MPKKLQSQKPSAAPQRRTQAERTKSMKKRLILATIQCLDEEGYAGTTVGKIATLAETSNGTPLHHFANKAAIIEATAEYLINDISHYAEHIINSTIKETGDFAAGAKTLWHQIYNSPNSGALLEIVLASKRDTQLEKRVGIHTVRTGTKVLKKTELWFESTDKRYRTRDLMTLLQWLMRGMALDAHMIKDPGELDRYIELSVAVIGQYVQPRVGMAEGAG